jgi:hypothetical protein
VAADQMLDLNLTRTPITREVRDQFKPKPATRP